MDLDAVVAEYYPKIYRRVCYRVPEQDAEDVTQDIFLNVTRSVKSFRGASAFETWLYRVTANRVANYFRKEYGRRAEPIDDIPESDLSYEQETDAVMDDILAQIPERYREALRMRFCDSMSFYEIAEETEMSYEGARSRYRRGVQKAAEVIQ